MKPSNDIEDAVLTLIRLLVDSPEGVSIEREPLANGVLFRILVAPEDVGKLIGKQGRTARALRSVVGAMGMAAKLRIDLDVLPRLRTHLLAACFVFAIGAGVATFLAGLPG